MESGKKRKKKKYYDYSLLFLILFLSCFGLVMIYSTSSYNAAKYYGDAMKYLKRQALFLVMGIPVMLFVSKINYHFYIKNFPLFRKAN